MPIPLPPDITEQQIQKCRETGDYCPVMFEWYKYVGLLANFFASIQLESPGIKQIPKIHYSVLIGLLNRCSRLILSNVTLSHEGLFGETTSIIDRSIFESSIKLSWLCYKGDTDSFTRFIAEGLKTELIFKNKILSNIENRSGNKTNIENRMLRSIDNFIKKSNLTEEEILNAKKLPNLAQMIEKIGKDKIAYIVGQRIGSHHVHGTWVSLWFHYVVEENGIIGPRDHDCPTHVNQYAFVPLSVLDAIIYFIHNFFTDKADVKTMSDMVEAISDEIVATFQEVMGNDNDII